MAETKKYANLESLQTFLNNLKSTFATLSHKHTISDITDYTVDTELSSTSVNPVQNKVLDAEFEAVSTAMGALELAIDEKANTSHTHDDRYYTETEIDSKLANKSDSTHNHTITASASDDDVVVLTGTNGTNKVTYSASHADSGVTAGTYKSVTVNAKGHVIAGSNPTTLEGYGITDAYTKTEVDTAIANSKNTWYATCPTAAATADKVVTTSSGDFALEAGNVVYVQFTYQAVADATLNVDGTGAITIQTVGTSATAAYYWSPNETVGFVYDGTYFRMIDSQIATTTYYGITKLSSSTSSTATNVAATPSAVKSAYDTAAAAMPKAGGTFTGATYAQANTSYTTYQLRNIALSTSAATPTGNGSILGVYS